MIDYTLQIDLSGGKDPNGYFDISVVQLEPMNSEYLDGNHRVERRGFGEVEVRNEPFKYTKLGGDRYKLYDIISSILPSQEIHFKFTSQYETLYSYFGIIDCKLNDDESNIIIKSYILDQYTDLVENRENEVKLFDETNQIANGDFKEWTGNNPKGWTLGGGLAATTVEKVFVNDKSAINISSEWTLFGETKTISQSILHVVKNNQLSLSFLWALTGQTSKRESLSYKLSLNGLYDLDISGKWIPYDSNYRNVYQSQALPLDVSNVQYNVYRVTSSKLPESGYLSLTLYHERGLFGDVTTNLIITDVILSTSAIELKTVKIQLNSEYLVTSNQDSPEIFWQKRKPTANFYSTKFHYEDVTLESFFDGNGKPVKGNLIMSDDNGITISDVIDIFQKPDSKSYKYELSKIDIFKCEYIATKKRRFRAICEFSREEIYYQKLSDGNGGFLPPADDSGWYNTFTEEPGNSSRYKWIRTPFNGIELPWIKGDINTGNWRTYKNTFGYYDSITSQKQYPVIIEKSIEINNAIDLRELFTKVYHETHISLMGKNVYSNFLWNDTLSVQETSDVYLNNSTSTNYVTMTDDLDNVEPPNELNKILAVHTYEFSTEPTTDKEKTILKLSFSDLMGDFMAHFPQCYWFVDENKDLHIEHVKYYDRVNKAKDLTIPQYKYLGNYKKWEYIKDKLYSNELYEFKNSGNINFIDSEVTFEKIVSNKRGQESKNNVSGKILSTDVQFCMENRDSLDNGIILIDFETKNDENICRYGVGQKTNKSVINGSLSIASLLEKYATYEGAWTQGKINGLGKYKDGYYNYRTTKHVKKGEEITIKGIFLDKIIFTNLGLGIVNKREVDYENEITKLVAVYRYNDPFPVYGSGQDVPVEEVTIPSVVIETLPVANIFGDIYFAGYISSGIDQVFSCGVAWSLSNNPTTSDMFAVNTNVVSVYTLKINSLEINTYYIRAFVTTENGIIYGNEITFEN